MTYDEAQTLAKDMREFADYIEKVGPKLPSPSFTVQVACYLTQNNYVHDEVTGGYKTVMDEAKTKANVREFIEAIGSCEKDYSHDYLKITKKFGQCKILGTVNRALTCKKKVVEKRVVPAVSYPERIEEVVEWECDDSPSLLALVKE